MARAPASGVGMMTESSLLGTVATMEASTSRPSSSTSTGRQDGREPPPKTSTDAPQRIWSPRFSEVGLARARR